MFRGREQSKPELGFRLLQRLAEDVTELGVVESKPKQDGRNMTMVFGSTRNKAQAQAARRKEQEQKKRERKGPESEAPEQDAAETATEAPAEA